MSYEQLAYVYDHLMDDAPYDRWVELLSQEKERFQVSGNQLLDIGCGTGELSIRLMKRGFQVTGVDISTDMLTVAAEKAAEEGMEFPLFQQDMSELEGLPTYDLVTIFCDSLNYLPSPEKVKQTFHNVCRHLSADGLFLFDVHSTYQMEHVFSNQTYTWNEEEIAYIWSSFKGEKPYSIEHELTFFVQDEGSHLYHRIDECHLQRTYPLKTYVEWLVDCGFEVLSTTADFTPDPPNETSKRIFFTCRKQERRNQISDSRARNV